MRNLLQMNYFQIFKKQLRVKWCKVKHIDPFPVNNVLKRPLLMILLLDTRY